MAYADGRVVGIGFEPDTAMIEKDQPGMVVPLQERREIEARVDRFTDAKRARNGAAATVRVVSLVSMRCRPRRR